MLRGKTSASVYVGFCHHCSANWDVTLMLHPNTSTLRASPAWFKSFWRHFHSFTTVNPPKKLIFFCSENRTCFFSCFLGSIWFCSWTMSHATRVSAVDRRWRPASKQPHTQINTCFTFVYSSDAAMTATRYVLSPMWAKTRAGLRTAWDSVCIFMWRRKSSSVAAGVQEEEMSLIAMITWKAWGCRGVGVSLCILGMMDEMIQPKGEGCGLEGNCAPEWWKIRQHQQTT